MGEKDLTFEMIPLRIMTILLEVLEHFLREKVVNSIFKIILLADKYWVKMWLIM